MAEHTRRKLFPYKFSYNIASVPSNIWNKRCLPLLTVDMRASALTSGAFQLGVLLA